MSVLANTMATLRRSRSVMISAGLLGAIAFFAVVGPWLSPNDYLTTDFERLLEAPTLRSMNLFGTDDLGQLILKSLSDKNGIGNGITLGLCVAFIGLAIDQVIRTWANERKKLLGLS